jgi:hypothetical protein
MFARYLQIVTTLRHSSLAIDLLPVKLFNGIRGIASSYYESLEALNGRFAKERKPAMKIVLVPDALEDWRCSTRGSWRRSSGLEQGDAKPGIVIDKNPNGFPLNRPQW